MYNKKGVQLQINTLIIVILSLIALIVVLFIFSGAMRQFATDIFIKLKNAFGLWNASEIKP